MELLIYQQGDDLQLVNIEAGKCYSATFQYPYGFDAIVNYCLERVAINTWHYAGNAEILIYNWEQNLSTREITIYFMTKGTPATVIITGILIIIGLVAISLTLKEIRLLTIGTPESPSPLRFGSGLLLIGLAVFILLSLFKKE